uniref:Uncharacterized protein n=1 Tax=Rhizophora mucronata TaxID=61149 RepID=A0A2P2NFT2_RHIMU
MCFLIFHMMLLCLSCSFVNSFSQHHSLSKLEFDSHIKPFSLINIDLCNVEGAWI